MADLGGTFDATQVKPQEPFDVIPAGKYKVQVTDSDLRPTKDGAGQYVWLQFEILEGEYKGRNLWERLHIINANQQTVDIAQRNLSALCHAVGKLHVADSQELHFIPLIVTVRVRPEKDGYDASNAIRGYQSVSGVTSSAPARPAATGARPTTPTPSAAAAPVSTAPWKRKTG